MKKILIPALLAALLSACGGGGSAGGATPSAAAPAAQTPIAPAVVTAPPETPSYTLSTPSANLSTDNTSALIKYAGTTNMALQGKGNKIWISDAQAMGTVTVTGSDNVIVFKPASTVASLTVSAGNTVYLPAGSPIKVEGSGATVNYYTK
ncbi:MAG: hypothetical protein JWP59_2329 [Massilia sp.]|nr:hypothetical protein [Massilia sp.]